MARITTNKNLLLYKTLSFTLMVFVILILAILLSHNPFEYSLNSTSLDDKKQFWLYEIRNISADMLFQLFGKFIYFVPIILGVWSYKLYFYIPINKVKLKLYSLSLLLLVIPALNYIAFGQFSGGMVGLYLANNVALFTKYSFILWPVSIVTALWIISIKPSEYWKILKLVCFVVTWIFIAISHYIKLVAIKIYSYFYYKIQQTAHKNTNVKHQKTAISTNVDHHDDIVTPSINHSPNNSNIKPALKRVINKNIDTNISNNSSYCLPINFLSEGDNSNIISPNSKVIKETAIKLEQAIKEFNINVKVVNIKTGPVVTLYEVDIPAGVKTSKLISLEADIALRMSAISVRIAIVPGKNVVGVEIPNKDRKTVFLRNILENKIFLQTEMKLPLVLGYDINGKPTIADLAAMPHLLIAGTTGSGKSVGINAMILSLLYKFSPQQLKLIMVDPKMLELSVYQDIPHLLTPVVTNPKQAVSALKWAVKEMEARYYKMSLIGVRNIAGYNERIKDLDFVDNMQRQIAEKQGLNIEFTSFPYLVVIIDEMADLMLVAGKEVENAVQRLAQMARAAGIHVIMATQRPSADIITGVIKSNFPTRISFQVSSKLDSRIILGEQGAEQLLGKGDMLYMAGVGKLQRIHSPFISDEEVSNIANCLRSIGEPNYITTVTQGLSDDNPNDQEDKDELYEEALHLIQQENKVSTSFLQRKFQIGYNRAARIVEQMEENGVISKPSASGKREILIR